MKILVTGGAGFVGSVLVPELLRAGHEVIVYDNLRYGGHGLLPLFREPSFSFVKGDVNDAETLSPCVARADAVVHLAAIVGYPACRKYAALAEATNVQGTRNVVEAIGEHQPLIYASTGSNYGQLEQVCTEESPLNPVSWYGITKAQGEQIALTAPRSTALRFATAFGVSPRMRLDLLVNDFVRMACLDRQLIVYEGHFRRTFIHVLDMARAIMFSIDHIDQMQGASFNTGHESMNLTKEAIARKIRERVDFYLHFAEIDSDSDKRDYEVSYDRLRNLGFETRVSIDQGIEELIRAMEAITIRNPYTNV